MRSSSKEHSQRYKRHVIGKCPKQILADIAHGAAGECHCVDDGAQISGHQYNRCTLYRNIGTGSHRDTDIRRRQGWCVIDTIANICEHLTPAAQLLHDPKVRAAYLGEEDFAV